MKLLILTPHDDGQGEADSVHYAEYYLVGDDVDYADVVKGLAKSVLPVRPTIISEDDWV